MKPGTMVCVLLAFAASSAQARITQHRGTDEALPEVKYIHVVSERASPIARTWIKSKDGVYVAAAIRKPKGDGPFPAVIMFHGAPGGRGMDQLVTWSRGDYGGPVWERLLQEGFVVVVADYRGGDWNQVNAPSTTVTTAIDDGVAVTKYVQELPYVDRAKVSLYGASLGGNLVMYVASQVPTVHAVVAGAPAPIWFLGYRISPDGTRPDFGATPPDPEVCKANITPITAPVLILVGGDDRLLPLDTRLHDELDRLGKSVQMDVYEHGYHDFVLGNQGQQRKDLPRGEILLPGALEALEVTVKFLRGGL